MKNDKIKLVATASAAIMMLFTACGEASSDTVAQLQTEDSKVTEAATEVEETTAVESKYELLDAFADLEVTFEGMSGDAEISVKYVGTDAYIKSCVKFYADEDTYYSNGDEVLITAVADFDMLHSAGYDLLERSKVYTVSGLNHYITADDIANLDYTMIAEDAELIRQWEETKSNAYGAGITVYGTNENGWEDDIVIGSKRETNGTDDNDECYWGGVYEITEMNCELVGLDFYEFDFENPYYNVIIYAKYKYSIKGQLCDTTWYEPTKDVLDKSSYFTAIYKGIEVDASGKVVNYKKGYYVDDEPYTATDITGYSANSYSWEEFQKTAVLESLIGVVENWKEYEYDESKLIPLS